MGKLQESVNRFDAAMDDDMNTADAMGALFEIVKEANVVLNENSSREALEKTLSTLQSLCDVLGILVKPYVMELPEEVQALADARAAARKEKNWQKSDELRDALKALGYMVEDTAKGQKISKLN